MNKFEQVSSLGNWMSLVSGQGRGPVQVVGPCTEGAK